MLFMEKRISVPVSESQHRALKLRAANTGKSIKTIVLTALAASGAIRYQPENRSRPNERS